MTPSVMSYSATFARTKPAYARAEATSRRGRRQWRRSRTAGVKGVDRPAGGSIQNGLCRSLISQNFLPKGDTNRRFRRTLRHKRFFGASDTTADQRAGGTFIFEEENRATFLPQRRGASAKVVLACAQK